MKITQTQLEQVNDRMQALIRSNSFYGKKLEAAGMTEVHTPEEFAKLPFSEKKDLRDAYPLGLMAVPEEEIVRIHSSSGTTGTPVIIPYTAKDVDDWAVQFKRCYETAGITQKDRIQITPGYGLWTAGIGFQNGAEKLGAMVIPMGPGNTEKQLKFMRDFGTDTIVATPSYCLYLAEAAREAGEEFPMDRYRLSLGLLGSEGCTPEMRDQIESRWGGGFFCTDNYGMSELNGPGMSGECRERAGLHINEDHFLCEVIDAASGQVLEKGSTGELVVTNLTKRGLPMLRYRTKDITRIDYSPCACGRTTARMHKIIGRSDDMLKIRGVNVFPSQVESALINIKHISPHYQLVVRRKGYADTLEVRVELIDGSLLEKYAELEALQKNIHDRIKAILGIEIAVSLVEPKSIERFTGKAQRVVDLRGQK